MRRDDHDEVVAWLRLNPTAQPMELARRFSWPSTTVYRHWKRLKAEASSPPPELKVATKPAERLPAAPKLRGAPAAQMNEDDREGVLATVRDTYAILRSAMRRLRQRFDAESEEFPELDRDVTQGLLNLQKTAAGLIDAHPGLMAMLRKVDDGEEVTDDDLKAILDGATLDR